MDLLTIILFALTGSVAGFFAGLLGIGGGVVMTPMLVIFLADIFPAEHVAHAAIASSLATIALTTMPSVWTHAKNKSVEWRTGILLAAGAMVGAFVCSRLAHHIPGQLLALFLALFLLKVAAGMFKDAPPLQTGGDPLPAALVSMAGVFTGGVSSLLGIGGGVFYTPFLTKRGLPVKRAIGTSSFVNSPLAIAAAAGYMISGFGDDTLPEGALGYVYLPATVSIAAFSMLFAFVGANMTAKLPDRTLRRVFGVLAALLSLRLLLRVIADV